MRVALTGGIGSGKSYIMKIFEALGAKTVYADRLNSELMEDEEYLKGLEELFPDCFSGGKPDKRAIRARIFSSEEERKKLNAYAHPKILKKMAEALSGEGVTVCEIPLLKESNARDIFDKVICVTAPDEVRRKRIAERDGVSEEEAMSAIASQSDEREYLRTADFIIVNVGDPTAEVGKIYDALCAKE